MKDSLITRTSTYFLQAVVVLIGIGVLAALLWEPHLEGRNVHATLFEVYFHDPFLAYAYSSSVAFFIALYQAFTLLGYARHNTVFSRDSVRALRTIQYCGAALVALIAAPLAYLLIVRPEDDIAGGVAMGLFAMCISVVIAAAAAVCERVVQCSPLTPR